MKLLEKIKKMVFCLSEPNQKINWYKTIVFNYLAFGFKKGCHLPVYIYRNTKIYNVGTINIKCPIKRGMIRIGQRDYKSQGETRFLNRGVIDIYGVVEIGGCCILNITGNLVLYNAVRIADGSLIVVREKVTIHEQTRLGFHCFLMDSDEHYTVDVNTMRIFRNTKPIEIGSYNWIANKTVIKKGVRTPDYLIVASSNALLVKDYSELPPYSIIGGTPAKLIKSGIRRIYNPYNESVLNKYFSSGSEINYYELALKGSETLDDYCKQGDEF